MVETEVFQHLHSLLHSTRVGSCAKSSESMVVGNTLEQYLRAINLESEVRSNLYCSNTEACGGAILLFAVGVENAYGCGIEVRSVAIPKLRVCNIDSLPFQLVGTHFAVERHVYGLVVNDVALWVFNNGLKLNVVLLSVVCHFHL